MKFATIKQYIDYNETLPCEAPGCKKKRRGKGKYCPTHGLHATYTGDPLVSPVINPNTYKGWFPYIGEVLDHTIGHPGYIAVAQAMVDKMHDAAEGRAIEAKRMWGLLATFNPSPREMVIRVTSIYILFIQKHPALASHRHLLFMSGKVLANFCPYQTLRGSAGYGEIRKIGTWLHDEFSSVFINLAQAAIQVFESKEERRQMLRTKFDLSWNQLPPQLRPRMKNTGKGRELAGELAEEQGEE